MYAAAAGPDGPRTLLSVPATAACTSTYGQPTRRNSWKRASQKQKIERAGVCTLCRNDVFYSFRREGPGCGHFGLMAALLDGPRARGFE